MSVILISISIFYFIRLISVLPNKRVFHLFVTTYIITINIKSNIHIQYVQFVTIHIFYVHSRKPTIISRKNHKIDRHCHNVFVSKFLTNKRRSHQQFYQKPDRGRCDSDGEQQKRACDCQKGQGTTDYGQRFFSWTKPDNNKFREINAIKMVFYKVIVVFSKSV